MTSFNKFRDDFSRSQPRREPVEAGTPLGDLVAAVTAAVETAAPVQSVLFRLGDNAMQDARECVDKAVALIQVEPLRLSGDVAPSITPGQAAEVVIVGGVRPYTVTLVGTASKHLTAAVDDSETAFARLKITAAAEATPGTYALEVTDKTSSSTRAMSVTVKAR